MQIVASMRKGKNVIQKTVRYVGVATDEEELEQLKQLAEAILNAIIKYRVSAVEKCRDGSRYK